MGIKSFSSSPKTLLRDMYMSMTQELNNLFLKGSLVEAMTNVKFPIVAKYPLSAPCLI